MRDCNATGSSTCDDASSTLCAGLVTTRVGEPDAGNLHVRFDEGEQLTAAPYSTVVVRPKAETAEGGRDKRKAHELAQAGKPAHRLGLEESRRRIDTAGIAPHRDLGRAVRSPSRAQVVEPQLAIRRDG